MAYEPKVGDEVCLRGELSGDVLNALHPQIMPGVTYRVFKVTPIAKAPPCISARFLTEVTHSLSRRIMSKRYDVNISKHARTGALAPVLLLRRGAY